MFYVYLHGLASSPRSTKAQVLRDRFRQQNLDLHCPDLNAGDFPHLTVSRQIRQVCHQIRHESQVVLIGSSLGGLTAAWVAQSQRNVVRTILLAPAFDFPDCWLDAAQLQQWRDSGWLTLYHYGEGRSQRLHYGFVEDSRRYAPTHLTRPVPTTILHGVADNVIPISLSRDYARTRPWATLQELDSDHALSNATEAIARTVLSHIA